VANPIARIVLTSSGLYQLADHATGLRPAHDMPCTTLAQAMARARARGYASAALVAPGAPGGYRVRNLSEGPR